MDLVVYDPTSSGLSWGPTAGRGGSKVLGYEFRRSQAAADGMFLTGLFPYEGGQQRAYVVQQIGNLTGGRKLSATIHTTSPNDGYRVTALFANPPSTAVIDTLASPASELSGEIGVIAHAIGVPWGLGRYGAQLVGSKLVHYGDELIKVTNAKGNLVKASVGVTWADGSIWGTIDQPGSSTLHVYLDQPSYSVSSIASLTWTGPGTPSYVTTTSPLGNTVVKLTVQGSGHFQLRETSGSFVLGPLSGCVTE